MHEPFEMASNLEFLDDLGFKGLSHKLSVREETGATGRHRFESGSGKWEP